MEAQAVNQSAIIPWRVLFDWFIPRSLKAIDRADIAEDNDPYQKALLVIAVFFVSILSIIGTNILLYNVAEPANQSYVSINLIVALTVGITALLFIRVADVSVNSMGNAYACVVLVSTMGCNMLTGFSWDSPSLPLILFIPVWTFLICDIKSGLFWSMITASVFFLVFLLEPLCVEFPRVFPEKMLSRVFLYTWLMTVCLVGFCVYAYQSSYKQLSERLARERSFFAYHADHDTLTGLANRSLFYRRAAKAVNFALEEGAKAAVIYIDLDDFKQINDNYGHQVGDELLINKAKKIKAAVRASDTVARLGGDEFGIILHAVNNETINRLMTSLKSELNEAVIINGISHKVTASLGLSMAPEHGIIIDDLMQHADHAMYSEKRGQPFIF